MTFMEKDAWNAFVGEYNSYFSTTREHIAVVWLRLFVNDLPLSLYLKFHRNKLFQLHQELELAQKNLH